MSQDILSVGLRRNDYRRLVLTCFVFESRGKERRKHAQNDMSRGKKAGNDKGASLLLAVPGMRPQHQILLQYYF